MRSRQKKKTSLQHQRDIVRNGNTVWEILEREMTQVGWKKDRKQEFMGCCYKGKDHRGLSMFVPPSYDDLTSSIPRHKPVFSPFIDLAVDEAYDLCRPYLQLMYDFLKKGKYKWQRHKVFRAFMTSMQFLQILSGPEAEWYQYEVSALITYKEIARQLNLSTAVSLKYYDGNEIDSPRARELKLKEAYALVEYLQLSNQVAQANTTGPSLALQNSFKLHMRAAIQLKDAIENARHVRLIGLEPSDDDSDGEPPYMELVADDDDSEEDDGSGDEGEIQILDYLYRRKVAVAAKMSPVASKTQPKNSKKKSSAPASSEKGGSHSGANKDKKEGAKALDHNQVVKVAAANILSENKLSNVTVASKTQPEASEKKETSGPENSRSPNDNSKLSPESQDEKSEQDTNGPKSVDKKVDAVAEKENKSRAPEGLAHSPGVDTTPDAVSLDVEKITPELVAKMQEELSVLRAKNEKMLANLRNKKSLLDQATASNKQLQGELRSQATNLHGSIASLRDGLENVTAARDKVRTKLRIESELLKQARLESEKLERQLKQSEKTRAMERELLDLYRELGNHTGYQRWGKRIRVLEAQLSEQKTNSSD